MNRRDLIQRVLVGTTALLVMPTTFTSCEKDPDTDPDSNNNNGGSKIDIDLSLAENSALNTAGGRKTIQGIIVANTGNNVFVALSSTCTHEGCQVDFSPAAGNFQCPCHGSVFAVTGLVVNGPAPTALKSYSVSKVGTVLTIFL